MFEWLMSNHPLVFQDDADYDRSFRVNVIAHTPKREDVYLLRVAKRRRVNLS
jgi:hypothetical protein